MFQVCQQMKHTYVKFKSITILQFKNEMNDTHKMSYQDIVILH